VDVSLRQLCHCCFYFAIYELLIGNAKLENEEDEANAKLENEEDAL
jgi:hypothetical protein